MIKIRKAKQEDAQRILEIYGYYIKNTAVTFEYEIPSLSDFKKRMERIMSKYPYIVIEKDGLTVGYAYASEFKSRAAYDWSSEASIYIDKEYRNQGLGKLLYSKLEKELNAMGIVNMYACVTATQTEDEYLNDNSLNFHKHIGFNFVGRFNSCGNKFGRWYDMVYLHKQIGEYVFSPEHPTFTKS